MRQIVLTLTLIVIAPVVDLAAAEKTQGQSETCGVCRGIVTSVETQGKFTMRTPKGDFTYMPRWVGGMPKDGGGFDPVTVAMVGKLKPGDVVEVKWEQDEHLRVVGLTCLGRATGVDESGPQAQAPAPAPAHPLDGPGPAERCGNARGVVGSVDPKGRFTIRTDSGEEVFVPHWRGGMPAEGGGFDKEMVAKIAKLKPGQQVEVVWEWNERKRCTGIKLAN